MEGRWPDFAIIASSAPLIRDGKIRPLAVSGSQRARAFPHVPTVDESGYKGIFSNAWQARSVRWPLLVLAGRP